MLKLFSKTPFKGFIQTLILISLSFLSTHILAEDVSDLSPQQAVQKLSQLQLKIEEEFKKLQKLQLEAIQKNPELETQRDDLESKIKARMKKLGTDVDALTEKMQAMVEKADAGGLSSEELKSMRENYQAMAKKRQNARLSALKEKDLADMNKAFGDALNDAIAEVKPDELEEIKQTLKETREKYQAIVKYLESKAPKQ